MSEFKSLEELYIHLEQDALTYKYSHQIGNLFKNLRDKLYENNDKKSAKIAQWEIDVFNFVFRDGECKPTWSGVRKDGKEFSFPSFSNWSEKTTDYIARRLNQTTHPLLRYKYSHVLWCSKRKHSKFGKITVDSYLVLSKAYENIDRQKPEDHYGNNIIQCITNAFHLALKIKYRFNDIKNEIIRLVHKFNEASSFCFALKMDFIKLMLKHNRKFLPEDFKGIDKICWNLADKLHKENRIHNATDILLIGEKVEAKTHSKQFNWELKIAESYEILTRTATSGLAAITFCKSAIQYYRKLRLSEKVIELEREFKNLREELELGEFKTNVDLSDHVKACRRIAKNIAKQSSDQIFQFLIFDKNLLPKKAELEKTVKKNAKEFPLQHLVPVTIHDRVGNPVQHFSDEEEKLYFHILQQYNFEMQMDKAHLIHEIIYHSISNEKITIETLFEFFKKYSWFAQSLQRIVFNRKIEYNWLDQLMPGLHEYIFQINNLLYAQNYYPNLILAIDSLTLKLEGLFRDFCHFAGITTFYFVKDKQNRDLAREKDINMLLREKPVQDLFDEDDLLFFKYLLTEKAGLNLRHKIAHSLIFFDEYSVQYLHLLFLCLLKLGKYNLNTQKEV
jgi:hypothetical protein